MRTNTTEFVIFRQAVYSSLYKFLFGIGLIAALLCIGINSLSECAPHTVSARNTVAKVQEDIRAEEMKLGVRVRLDAKYGLAYDMTLAKRHLEAQLASWTPFYWVVLIITLVIVAMTPATSSRIFIPDSPENKIYMTKTSLPFTKAVFMIR